MSVTFTKLFSSITESTIWAEPDHTRIVWITMLAMADRFGRVWASIPGLANRARVPLSECELALETLLGPDKYSRTKDNEGRRIEPIDGGWRLLNHEKYRAIRDEEAIKESKRKYINSRRAVERANLQSNEVYRSRANAEAYTEAENTNTSGFALFWSQWPSGPRKTAKKQCEAKWRVQGCEVVKADIWMKLAWLRDSEQWKKDQGAFIPAPMTWLNKRGWEFEVPKPPEDHSREALGQMEKDRIESQSPESIAAREKAVAKITQLSLGAIRNVK